MTTETIIIAGAGLTGAAAAETLREEGYAGRIVLIGDEPVRPYERPPLSKEALQGAQPFTDAFVHSEAFYADHAIDLRTGVAVANVDPAGRWLKLSDGATLPYDGLLIATGAAARRLTVPGADLDGVRALRTMADAEALQADLRHSSHAVVVGGGWIGCEVAASARSFGVDVTLIIRGAEPLDHVLGPQLGAFYGGVHRQHGVRMIAGDSVASIEGAGRVERVRTEAGRTIDCDLVVAGIGAVPRADLGATAGARVADGIEVDARLATRVPGVFAAGDVALHDHPTYGPIRLEHVTNARKQGQVAARSMLGATKPYEEVPYFYSDQYDVGMEYAGVTALTDRLVLRGDRDAAEFIAFWLRGDRVVAGMNVGIWDVTHDIQRLIRDEIAVDDARLSDPDVPIAEVAGAHA